MTSSPAPVRADRLVIGSGMLLTLLGLLGAAGWLGRIPLLVAPLPGHGVLYPYGAVSLLAAGVALVLQAHRARPAARRAATLLAVLLAMGSCVLLVLMALAPSDTAVFDAARRSWLAALDPHPRPRLLLIAAFAVASAPIAWLGWSRERLARRVARFIAAGLALLALGATLADRVGVGYLYSPILFSLPALHMLAALPLLALGIWGLSRPPAESPPAQDRSIVRAAAVALGLTLLAAAVLAFTWSRQQLERSTRELLSARLAHHVRLFETELRHAVASARVTAYRPGLTESIRILQDPDATADARAAARLGAERALSILIVEGFSGIRVTGTGGEVLLDVGRLRDAAGMTAALDAQRALELRWDDELILRTRTPLGAQDGPTATMIADQALPETTYLLRAVGDLGETGEVGLCARQGAEKLCFPSRFARVGVRAPVQTPPRLPTDRALAGEEGVFRVVDYRREETLSAVRPIPTFPLAMVAKTDLEELFAPVRRQIEWGLPMVALVTLAGVLLLRARVRPLAQALMGAKQEAEENAARWRALNDSALDGFFLLDAVRDANGAIVDLRVVEMNPAAERMAGLLIADARGHLVSEIFPDPKRHPLYAECISAIETRQPTVAESGGFSASAREKGAWFLHNVVPHGDGVAVTTKELSERRRMEVALREARERLQLVTDNTPVLLSYLDRDERFIFANRAYAEMIGLDPESMVGRQARDVLGEKEYARVSPAVRRVMRGQRVRFGQWRLMNGRRRYLVATYVPDRGPDGRPRGFFASVVDHTALRTAEEEARAAAERLQTITDNLPVMVAFLDADRVFRFNNRAYEFWYGRPLSDITGHPLREFVDPHAYALNCEAMDRAAATRRLASVERRVEKDGRVYYMEVMFSPQFNEEGRLLGYCAVTKDITESKLHEERLRDAARRDALTGLNNRAAFEERLEALLRGPRAALQAVAYLDLDYFKRVNDEHGHAAGDAFLKSFAQRVQQALRHSDFFARIGGDEFALILDEVRERSDLDRVMGKLYAALAEPFVFEAGRIPISASVGLAVIEPADTADSVLKRADAALYEAKARGRNTYVLADGDGRDSALNRRHA